MEIKPHPKALRLLTLAGVFVLAGCTAKVDGRDEPADQFLAAIASHCGQAFAGRVTINEPASSVPDPFHGVTPVLHVRDCDASTSGIFLPLHVGDDHSRAWAFTRTRQGLRFRHYQWRADGTPDAVTHFGGQTVAVGSATRQIFPVDAESIATFRREGLPASLQNSWTLDVKQGQHFFYELSRPDGRVFRVEFDLSRPVPLPPPPWGEASGQGA